MHYRYKKNGGGSDRYWQCNIVLPNLKESISLDYYSLIKGSNCLEYVKENGIRTYPISEFPLDLFENLNKHELNQYDYYSISNFTIDREGSEPYDVLFSGDFWVLIGPQVYLASESFVRFCKESSFAKLIGTATSGGGGGLAPEIFVLPETGICVRFSPMNLLNSDGSYNEETGTVPDVVTPPGEDALTQCLQIIAGQNYLEPRR